MITIVQKEWQPKGSVAFTVSRTNWANTRNFPFEAKKLSELLSTLDVEEGTKEVRMNPEDLAEWDKLFLGKERIVLVDKK